MSQPYQIIRSPKQAKQWLRRQGKTVRAFCREHGLDEQAAYEVLSGRQTGHFGKAHQAAVALGIKPDPDNPAPAITREELAQLQAFAAKGLQLQPTGER